MLNRKTILQLYNGELYPAENIVPTSPKYKSNCSNVKILHEKISTLLKLEDKNLVEEYRDIIESKASQELDITFCDGFALGLRLTAEALIDSEDN